MLGITDLWLFVAAGLLLNVTPGPDMAFIIARSAQLGVRAGVVAALGISGGCFVHIAAAALGLSAILATSAHAFFVLKLIGAAYLIWMGISMLRDAGLRDAGLRDARLGNARLGDAGGGAVVGGGKKSAITLRGIFLQGFFTNALNPKVALFFLAFLPQFIVADAPSKAAAFVVLGLIFCATGTAVCLLVAWLAAGVSSVFGAGSAARTWIERVLGGLFVALGIKLALVQRSG